MEMPAVGGVFGPVIDARPDDERARCAATQILGPDVVAAVVEADADIGERLAVRRPAMPIGARLRIVDDRLYRLRAVERHHMDAAEIVGFYLVGDGQLRAVGRKAMVVVVVDEAARVDLDRLTALDRNPPNSSLAVVDQALPVAAPVRGLDLAVEVAHDPAIAIAADSDHLERRLDRGRVTRVGHIAEPRNGDLDIGEGCRLGDIVVVRAQREADQIGRLESHPEAASGMGQFAVRAR